MSAMHLKRWKIQKILQLNRLKVHKANYFFGEAKIIKDRGTKEKTQIAAEITSPALQQ